jgi:hypothetical protein
MSSMEDPPKDLYEGKVLSDEDIMYRRSATGEIVSKSNNLWLNVQYAPADAEPDMAVYFQGEKIAEMIKNPVDRARFEELTKGLASIASWELQGDDRWRAITSDEANRVYVEIYQIARRNGISNKILFS